MGFISELARGRKDGASQSHWRQVFGTDKETGSKPKPRDSVAPAPGGSWGRSATANASFIRLLQAMRSMAPGGWSDDRWEQSRHFVGIAYVAIHRSCEQMSQAEFKVSRVDPSHPDGKRPVTKRNDPDGYRLVELLERPNREDSFGDLLYRWNQQLDLTGTALTWMVPNKLGVPFELYPIPTAIAVPQPSINPDYPDGYYRIQPVYPYGPFSSHPTPNSAVGAPIPAQWMMRFKYPHPLLRYEGYSPLTALRLHLDEIEAMDRSRWYSMKRTFRPNVVLQMDEMEGVEPLPQTEIERIRAEIENAFMGPENVGNLFVASPGSRLEEFGNRPVDMDYQAGWSQLVDFTMAGLGITKGAAGLTEGISSYAALFAMLKQLHLLTLEPKCSRMAAGITRHVAPFFGDDLIVEIRCQRIDDHEVRNQKLDKLIGAKAMTINELRKELDLPLVKEDWGEDRVGEEPKQDQPGAMVGDSESEDPMNPGAIPDDGEEVAGTRPDTGGLGLGALGPQQKRLHLNGNGRQR